MTEQTAPEWWDADHGRSADAYTPPERAYCRRCGMGQAFHAATCEENVSRAIRSPHPATESDATPESGPVSDRDAQDAREARYAEAIMGGKDRAALLAIRNPGEVANAHRDARVVMAVADAELAPLVARVAELEAERDAYRKAKQENDERFQIEAATQRERAERAEAALARVEALADEWSSDTEMREFDLDSEAGIRWTPRGHFAVRLRAALAAAGPAVSDAACPTCGKARGDLTPGPHKEGWGVCPESFHFRSPAASDGEGATSEATRRATFAEVSRAMNRTANVWEDDGSDPCRVRITREYANAYRAYAEGLGEPTGSKGF